MFEKIGRLAEAAATNVSVSRRGFLGRLGQGALAMTGVLGGLLAIPRDTRAGGSYVCCKWTCVIRYKTPQKVTRTACLPPGSSCPYPYGLGCQLPKQTMVSSCSQCK
jgi:hypothetical protein